MNARNPSTLAKLRAEAALCRNDLLARGHKIPKQPDLEHRNPTMRLGDREVPVFVAARADAYLAGKLSLWSLVRSLDAGTVQDILDIADAIKSGHLPAPDWAKEVAT